ncbi:MAG: GNAT family N-acetyltransferase [Caldilineaceae bacterium]
MSTHPTIHIRPATAADREQIIAVEAKSTPGLRYVPHVFELFLNEKRGGFLVAEMGDEIVACAKFTVVPDGSAWLETLRVIPERQGLGVGKRLYEEFFAIARREEVTTMRMYTGTKNVVSKGLAARFGFQPAMTFYGAALALDQTTVAGAGDTEALAFQPVTDPQAAAALMLPHREQWHDFLVMNRTFYKLSPALCAHLAQTGQVFAEPVSGSVIVAGARFMPEQALHIGFVAGAVNRALAFARTLAEQRGIPRFSCLFPTGAELLNSTLRAQGLQVEAGEFIVMEWNKQR